MSSLVEDPGIPLIGITHSPPLYTPTATPTPTPTTTHDPDQHARRFVTVGSRLVRRKELYVKRKRLCDVSLALALTGVLLMVLETELVAHDVVSRADVSSFLLKLGVTLSTAGCVAVTAWYHVLDVRLFTINNSMEDWRLAITPRRLAAMAVEMAVLLVHPVPGDFHVSWMTMDSDGDLSARRVSIPLDVVLSLPMFLRLYLVLRCIMLHSRLYQDASSQSLGALNRIHFNFRFIFKSMMALYPDYAIGALVLSFFLIASWTLRLCEMNNDGDHARVHGNFLNSMWVIAITFLTVGYGDIVPNTLCGRGIAVVSGMMGAGCTALVVAVLARKIELSRAEKYVHDFVLEVDLDKQLRHQAASVVKRAWRIYQLTKLRHKAALSQAQDRQLLKQQSDLLRAIYAIREIKNAQRRLSDNALSMLDVHKAQREIAVQLDSLHCQQRSLEGKVNGLGEKMAIIYNKLCSLERAGRRP
ncbi:small conductance calcium-activated potassium channel protein-like [Babylonia areolata]|uniref:small conductance calcium-activated potassium channel protein-like n=1 Tax=Babylonia areolata TaxID=304850 RepID=UPI003FCF060D